nr:hypothetical protein [Verrucomicrobium spinosum]
MHDGDLEAGTVGVHGAAGGADGDDALPGVDVALYGHLGVDVLEENAKEAAETLQSLKGATPGELGALGDDGVRAQETGHRGDITVLKRGVQLLDKLQSWRGGRRDGVFFHGWGLYPGFPLGMQAWVYFV